jgi:O-antigen/teichoic acid export membrane protein
MIIGVLIVALTARYLGPEGRGMLAVLTTWAVGFATLFHLSLGQVALHLAAGREDKGWLDETLASLVAWCVAATLLAWVSSVLLYEATAGRAFGTLSPGLLAVGMLIIPLLVWEQYGSSLLMALNRLDVANLYQVIGRTVTLVVVVMGLLLIGPWVACVLVANLLGQAVVAFGGLRHMRRHFVGPRWAISLPGLLRSGLHLHFNAVGTFLFASCDILILNHFAGPAETGYYQLGVQLLAVLMVLPQAAGSVLYAKVAELGPDRAWAVQRRIILQILGLMLVIVATAAFLAEPIVIVVAGQAFLPTVEVFRWQLLSVIGMSLAALMAPQWIGRGLFRTASMLTLAFGVINVSLSLWLVQEHGKLGVAWAGAATFLVAIVSNGAFAWWCGRRAHGAAASIGQA